MLFGFKREVEALLRAQGDGPTVLFGFKREVETLLKNRGSLVGKNYFKRMGL